MEQTKEMNPTPPRFPEGVGERKCIVVIGAGVAGLSCARTLQIKCPDKYSIIILDARDRIGGRILSYTSPLDGTVVDLGASFIHGTKENPVYRLKQQLNIPNKPSGYRNGWLEVDEDGTPIGENSADFALKAIGQHISQNAMSKLDKTIGKSIVNDPEKDDISIGEGLQQILHKYFPEEVAAIQGTLGQRVFDYERWVEEEWCGGDLDVLSLRQRCGGAETGFSGGNVSVIGGYINLIGRLVQSSTHLQIRLNTIVKRVEYGGTSSQHRCRVVTNREEVIECDAVVVTVSVGVLKKCIAERKQSTESEMDRGAITFIPELPLRKRVAIQRLEMGLMDKAVISFRETFVGSDLRRISYMSSKRGEWPWIDVTNESGRTFLAWTAAKYAHEMEGRSDEQVKSEIVQILRKIFERKPRKTSRQAAPKVGEVVDFYVTRWENDPFALGSYSLHPPGAVPEDNDELAEAVCAEDGARVLFFAGEATDRRYYGTVHSAYLSGVREANNIMKHLS